MAVNHLVFQGRTTKELTLSHTQSGIENVSFTLAWSEKYKETERKCFLRCKAWRQTAAFLDKYFHGKGSEMIVEGQIETNEWDDNDGSKHSQIVLNVDKVHFCGKKQDTAQAAQPTQPVPDNGGMVQVDEPLPF